MLLAQLEHKIPTEYEGMEDVLTSSVIGLLKYLPHDVGGSFLAKLADIPLPQGSLNIELWPRYPTPAGFRRPSDPQGDAEGADRGDTEPDAVITAGQWLILIEAKYRSPLDETYDQLGREFAIGFQLAQRDSRRFRLVVVTANTLQPAPSGVDLVTGVSGALRDASASRGGEAERMIATVLSSLRWTNWQRLYTLFAEVAADQTTPASVRELLADVCRLLELRGLKPYDSQSLAAAMIRWDAAAIPDELWSSPVAYRYAVVSSAAAGWEQVLRMDVSALVPLGWQPIIQTTAYALGTRLAGFDLGTLRVLKWCPVRI